MSVYFCVCPCVFLNCLVKKKKIDRYDKSAAYLPMMMTVLLVELVAVVMTLLMVEALTIGLAQE